MTSQEFKRWLAKRGCTFESGHGGHLIVRLGTRMSVLPMHGKQKELGHWTRKPNQEGLESEETLAHSAGGRGAKIP
jgi:mRNA interferase HicA